MIRIKLTDKPKEDILKEMKEAGYSLIEEQTHFDGEFMVFDVPKPEPLTLEQRITQLEKQVEELLKPPEVIVTPIGITSPLKG